MEFATRSCADIEGKLVRLDSEFHLGMRKIDLDRLKGYDLGDLCSKVVQGPNPTFLETGIPSLNGKNIYFGTLEVGQRNYISEDEYNNFEPFHLRNNDILITLKHASRVGRLWIYRSRNKCLFSRNLGLIRLKEPFLIEPEILVFYLWGGIPQQLLNVIATGGTNGQITLSMAELRKFPVPKLSKGFQGVLKAMFRGSERLAKEADMVHAEAESLLLTELGLVNWQPKHELSFVKNCSDTERAGRFDAEYYQPKYEKIIGIAKSYKGGWDILGDVVNIKDKGLLPKAKQEYKYIELANIDGKGGIAGCMREEGQALPSRARRKVDAGDVIVSSVEGSLSSIALIQDEYHASLCSTGFHVINSSTMNGETLFVFLKSIAGQLQAKKGCSGTILTAIGKDEFCKIVLPRVPERIQNRIQNRIAKSFHLRNQVKELLACGKKAVEISVQEDEEAARVWLDGNARNVRAADQ